jgi:hypothetical protein
MSLLSRLDSRFGRYAVPNLTVILIAGQVFLYVAHHLAPAPGGNDVLDRIRLYPGEVLQGEFWRLLTFLFDPPLRNPLFAFFFWYLFYLMGTALETTWSAFRYNVFLAIGYFATVISTFAFYFALGGLVLPATNGFLYGTVFLAFARLYPDFTLHLFFILPVKIKWLAMLQWAWYAVAFVFSPSWMVRAVIAASVLNFFLFFGRDIWRGMKQGHRRMKHQARTLRTPQRIVHKCRVCGLTSDDAPQSQFRYCSRCEGEACYCPEHLHNHEHVVKESATAQRTEA